MAIIKNLTFQVPTNPAVKWLATQERNLNKDIPYEPTEIPEDYVSRIYLQFLWLPQSIMPLQFIIPALLRVSTSASETTSQESPGHPLHHLLRPVLLTSRSASQKYHTRIPSTLSEENEPSDPEEEYMWYAYHKDKTSEEEEMLDGKDEYEVQERLKATWLQKYERREIQIQTLLHFLLISLPGGRAAPYIDSRRAAVADALPPSLSPSKSKKRKQKDHGIGRALEPPPQPLEERLESYMDKLAMWQLMQSVDSSLDRHVAQKNDKRSDARDWMQVFCEDVVEPLFKNKLPELCSLFHSKLFPDLGNSDTDSLGLSPQVSPKPATKRLKSSASTSASVASARLKTYDQRKENDARNRSRSASLSLSLELEAEKRERSRSLSIGPNGLRKRPMVYEVTMTTKFGKARAKQKAAERTASVAGPSLSRTQSQQYVTGGARDAMSGEKRTRSMGKILVEATPSKPRDSLSRSQSQKSRSQSRSQARLPSLFAESSIPRTQSQLSQVAFSHSQTMLDSDEEDDDGYDTVVTPTKARRYRRRSQVPQDEHERQLNGSQEILQLGLLNSSQLSEDDGPPEISSPDDLGGADARPRVMVIDTP